MMVNNASHKEAAKSQDQKAPEILPEVLNVRFTRALREGKGKHQNNFYGSEYIFYATISVPRTGYWRMGPTAIIYHLEFAL